MRGSDKQMQLGLRARISRVPSPSSTPNPNPLLAIAQWQVEQVVEHGAVVRQSIPHRPESHGGAHLPRLFLTELCFRLLMVIPIKIGKRGSCSAGSARRSRELKIYLTFHADMGVISLALIDLVRGRSAIPFPFFFRFLARIVGLQVLPR